MTKEHQNSIYIADRNSNILYVNYYSKDRVSIARKGDWYHF